MSRHISTSSTPATKSSSVVSKRKSISSHLRPSTSSPMTLQMRNNADIAPDVGSSGREKKVDITQVEDVFRANRLAGLGDRYHALNKAFDLVRESTAITPKLEADLAHIYDVTSLRTADSRQVRKAKTQALVEHYQRRPGDTGSPEVQVVLLTERVNYLKFHMTRHRADVALKLNFHKIEVRRRKLLKYLKKERFRTYQVICRDLGIDEESMDVVGRLKHTRPYYDPDRPKYRKPMSAQELRDVAKNEEASRAQAEVDRVRQRQVQKKDEALQRRLYNEQYMMRKKGASAATAAAAADALPPSTQEEEDVNDVLDEHLTASGDQRKNDV